MLMAAENTRRDPIRKEIPLKSRSFNISLVLMAAENTRRDPIRKEIPLKSRSFNISLVTDLSGSKILKVTLWSF
jgi:hypothetical protein